MLQHRVAWSHFGGTWGLPGGALDEGESAVGGAIREAQEETGVPDAAVRPRVTSCLDLGIWSYTTVIADVVQPFEPEITDPEPADKPDQTAFTTSQGTTIAMLSSLVVALSIVPVLSYWFLKPPKDIGDAEAVRQEAEEKEHKSLLQRAYKPILRGTQRHPVIRRCCC